MRVTSRCAEPLGRAATRENDAETGELGILMIVDKVLFELFVNEKENNGFGDAKQGSADTTPETAEPIRLVNVPGATDKTVALDVLIQLLLRPHYPYWRRQYDLGRAGRGGLMWIIFK